MLCRRPFKPSSSAVEFRCCQCAACRINRRKEWTARAMLEGISSASSVFVTWTYSNERLPEGNAVSVSEWQGLAKRLRSHFGPFRFLAVGEYGSQSWRPHYHALLYGSIAATLEEWDAAAKAAWQNRGHVLTVPLSLATCGYVARYVQKRMHRAEDPRLQGRNPEFMRMSLRPGLGASALDQLEAVHYTDAAASFLAEHHDVLSSVRFDGKVYPIGRYLRGKLRERLGLPSSDPRRLEDVAAQQAARAAPEFGAALERRREAHERVAARRLESRRSI